MLVFLISLSEFIRLKIKKINKINKKIKKTHHKARLDIDTTIKRIMVLVTWVVDMGNSFNKEVMFRLTFSTCKIYLDCVITF